MPSLKRILQRAVQVAAQASMKGLEKGPHITRYAMYRHLAQFDGAIPPGRVLSISGSQSLCRVLGVADAAITDASYPEANVLDLPIEDAAFSGVVSDQVLEHIEGDPQRAVDECFRVLKPGGVAVHATCFMNPVHAAPGDFWRFTPDALRLLVAEHGTVLDAGGWGNPYIWPYAAAGLRFQPVPHARWHPFQKLATYNDPTWPVVTWVVAQKHAD